jgi:O-antigen/teichoic acid export membrane protein
MTNVRLVSLIPKYNSVYWSLADQLLVSGCNFIVGIVLARTLGVEAFGAYVIAQMYLLYANTFQASLVVSPMMTVVPAGQTPAVRRRLIRGFLGFTLLVMLFTGLGVEVIAWLIGYVSPHLGVGKLALPLAAAMGAFQLQDWVRRALYVQSDNRQVFLIDVIAYGGQLAALLGISAQIEMHPDIALWVMATCFALSAIPTIAYAKLWPDFVSTWTIIRTHWRSSRDLFTTWQLQWLGSQGVILLGTGVVGPQAAGAIRAAQNLLGPVNVLLQWMDNVVPVRAALQLKVWGRGALVTYLGRIAWVGILVLSLLALVLVLVDEPLIVFLYGEAYRPFAVLVVLQALYYLFGHGYRMVNYFHRALGNTGVLAQSSLWWAVVAVIFALMTVNWLGEQGIMLALVIGEGAALIYSLWRGPAKPETGANALFLSGKPHYVLLRRSDGSPHLVLPLSNSFVVHSALRMYAPSRWTGRLYRASLVWTLPWRVRFGWVEPANSLDVWCEDLTAVLAAVPGASVDNIGILVGNPGPLSKLTLKLMNERGDALAYARIASLPDAVRVIRHECKVLTAVGATSVGGQTPRLLSHGEFTGATGCFMVESAGPEADPTHELGEVHFAFLAGLLGNLTVAWTAAIDQVEAETAKLRMVPAYAHIVASALSYLRDKPGPSLLMAIEHGDFAPWNIHRTADGQIFVFDWEHARLDGLPWQDALHFSYQWAALVQRQDSKQVLETLRAVFKLAAANSYATALLRHAVYQQQLIAIYLLRKLVTCAAQGKSPTSREQLRCLEVLGMLLMGTKK